MANDSTVTITVEERQFKFDLKELTKVSPYFEIMFNGSFAESKKNEVKLEEVGLEMFHFFSEWISNREINVDEVDCEFLLQVFLFSDRFMVGNLKKICCERFVLLLSDCTDEFRRQVLELAIDVNCSQLKEPFTSWFYRDKLKTPEEWTLRNIEKCILVREKYRKERFDEFTKNTTDKVKEALEEMLNSHETLLEEKKNTIIQEIMRTNKFDFMNKMLEYMPYA